MKKETWLPGEIYKNRKLVFSLAKNDFKTKYAGSYFGTVWAFVQPIVTICVYWFVFGLALRNGSDKGVPFVLWLIAGLVPWFFIQEGLTGGTNALLEYNYLVKKVVFNIRILPVVKVFSAVFVHCFFVVIVLSAENKKQFFIPKNFAHGFVVLSDSAEFAYKCTDFYHPNDEGGLAYNDPDIGVEWPIPEGMELILSDKDQKWGSFKEYTANRSKKD